MIFTILVGFFFQISMTHHYRITIIKELSTFAFSSSCHKLYTPGKLGKIRVDMFKLCSYSLINIQIPEKESKNVSMHSIYAFIYDIINDHNVTCVHPRLTSHWQVVSSPIIIKELENNMTIFWYVRL